MFGGSAGQEVQINKGQILRFLGAYKLGLITKERDWYEDDRLLLEWRFRNPESVAIAELATEELFVAAITAFDFAATKRGEKVLLWTTKIACPSVGLRLDETLPAMLALAAPHIGRETPKPVSIKASDKFKPDVQIGDPKFVEYIEQTPLVVIESPSGSAKKSTDRGHKKSNK